MTLGMLRIRRNRPSGAVKWLMWALTAMCFLSTHCEGFSLKMNLGAPGGRSYLDSLGSKTSDASGSPAAPSPFATSPPMSAAQEASSPSMIGEPANESTQPTTLISEETSAKTSFYQPVGVETSAGETPAPKDPPELSTYEAPDPSSLRSRILNWVEELERKQAATFEGVDDFELVWEDIWAAYSSTQKEFVEKQLHNIQQAAQQAAEDSKSLLKGKSRPAPKKPGLDTNGMTKRIMEKLPLGGQATGAGGATTYDAFLRAEQNWKNLRQLYPQPLKDQRPDFVHTSKEKGGSPRCWDKLHEQRRANKPLDYDTIVCGGTLGIFFAIALLLKGHKVAVLEAGQLRGREQEWNISYGEMMELMDLEVLSKDDVDACITTEFPGCRSGFKNEEVTPLEGGYFDNDVGYECFTENVLNLGISPAILLERAKIRFQGLGGDLYEETRLAGVVVGESGAALDVGSEWEPITSRLVVDCMGNASPISAQSRRGARPDGICAVVGTCAAGYDSDTNCVGDIIYTNTEIQDNGVNGKNQYFWEAFPVGIGSNGVERSDVKTTYMFTYMDAHHRRPSLENLMEDYWRLLPIYQPSITNPESDLDVKRTLFAYFPTYKDSPLKPQWDRVVAVGDASGIQSPLSFGGLGALTRHLGRISGALSEAIDHDLLDKDHLGQINAYTPNLSAAWMMQRAMSVRMGQQVNAKFMNRLLATNFEVMDGMGEDTIKPFLQDVIRFDGLVGSLARSFVKDPTFMPQIVAHVGVSVLAEWMGHVTMMGTYAALDTYASPIVGPVVEAGLRNESKKFAWRRRLEAWRFGSGNDYVLPSEKRTAAMKKD